MKNTMQVFFPPGVQVRLQAALGRVPRVLPSLEAQALDLLWAARCSAPESELERIDGEMLKLAIAAIGGGK